MSKSIETVIDIFRDGSSLTLSSPSPMVEPVFQATCIHPWSITGTNLVVDLGTRSETFCATAVVHSAISGWFGFAELWRAPGFLKGKDAATAKGTAPTKAKAARAKKVKEPALIPSDEEATT